MSLSYFYSLTNLSSGIIRDQWTYNAATGLGLFTGNSGANLISRPVSGNNFEDFSLFFTYDKRRSNFNTGASYLFSNYSGNNGFSFGLDSCNFPFIKTNNECFSFTDFNLGVKNCLCLQKSDNNFSLLRYDIPSAELIESESFFVSPSTQLSGGGYTFGASSGFISGVNNFYGAVDQLLFLSERVSKESCVTIFSGFSILEVTYDLLGSYYVESEEWYVPDAAFTTGQQAHISEFLTTIYQPDHLVAEDLTANSTYAGRLVFSGITSGYDVDFFNGIAGDEFCQTGNLAYISNDFMPSGTGFPSSFNVSVNYSVGPYTTRLGVETPNDFFFTYDLSELYKGLRYNNVYVLGYSESTVQSSNPNYFSGFEMNGVFVPQAQAALLGTFESGSSSDIGNEAIFDSVSGVFRATNVNSGIPIYLNGESNTGFSFESNIIDIQNYTETSADSVVYDRVSGLQLVSFSNSNSATGSYWAKTSFVATGEYSFEKLFRIRESEFYETSPYHLYHGKRYQEGFSTPIFENLDENWS